MIPFLSVGTDKKYSDHHMIYALSIIKGWGAMISLPIIRQTANLPIITPLSYCWLNITAILDAFGDLATISYGFSHHSCALQSCHAFLFHHFVLRNLNFWSQSHWPQICPFSSMQVELLLQFRVNAIRYRKLFSGIVVLKVIF